MHQEHKECIEKLVEIGRRLGFEASRAIKGKMYELANPDFQPFSYYAKAKEDDIIILADLFMSYALSKSFNYRVTIFVGGKHESNA